MDDDHKIQNKDLHPVPVLGRGYFLRMYDPIAGTRRSIAEMEIKQTKLEIVSNSIPVVDQNE